MRHRLARLVVLALAARGAPPTSPMDAARVVDLTHPFDEQTIY